MSSSHDSQSVHSAERRRPEPALTPLRFYQEAYGAIVDFGSYQRIFEQSLRRSLIYLLFLCAHIALVQTTTWAWYQMPAVLRLIDWAQHNFPPLEIRDGLLRVEANEPIVKEYLGDRVYTFVFDTTGQSEPIHKLNPPAVVLSRENLHLMDGGKTQTWPWSVWHELGGDFVVGPEQWLAAKDWFNTAFYPVGYTAFLLLALFAKSIQALLLSFFSASSAARQGVRLGFRSYFTVALYGLTPAVALSLALAASGIAVPLFDFIYLATAAIYSYLAMQRCVSTA